MGVVTDSGYQGLQKHHSKTQMPKKRSKKNPLTKEDKKSNPQILEVPKNLWQDARLVVFHSEYTSKKR